MSAPSVMDWWGLLTVVAALASFATVAGFLGRLGWVCELCSHFRTQYALVLIAATAAFSAGGRREEAMASGLFALAPVWSILPLYRRPANAPRPARTLRVWLLNVNFRNRAYARTVQAIRQADADAILLMEVDRAWMDALAPLRADYPHARALILDRGFGIALLSRLPLDHAEIRTIGPANLPSVIARFRWEHASVSLIGTHPLSPIRPRHARLRDEQMRALAHHISGLEGPVLLLGDFNMTSWSPVFTEVLQRTGLRDSRVGHGLQPSWPAFAASLGIPIDHCLVSRHVTVHRRRAGPSVGSDHLPVLIEVSVEPVAPGGR